MLTTEPRCRHFGVCGGCDLQDHPYPKQLELKRDRLVRALNGLVPADRVRSCVASDTADAPWGLRRKVHFAFTDDRGRLALAHHAKAGRKLVSVRECPVHAPEGNRLAEALRAALDDAGARAHPHGPLRHVVVRAPRSPSPAVVTLVVTVDGDARVRRGVGRFLDGERNRVSVDVNVNDEDTPYIFGRETRHIAGPARSLERVNGLDYQISPTSFFQTNVDAAELLVRLVLEAAGPPGTGSTAVDLYAGVGLFALQLAAAGFRVLAVEENPRAIDDGAASARENRIPATRCQFIRSPVRRVERWSRDVRSEVGVLVVDPPRAGVGSALLGDILDRLTPARVVYVSCDPVSLAADLAVIRSDGSRQSERRLAYDVESVQPVDMFPQTTHVEAVVTLKRTAKDGGVRGEVHASSGVKGTRRPRRTPRVGQMRPAQT